MTPDPASGTQPSFFDDDQVPTDTDLGDFDEDLESDDEPALQVRQPELPGDVTDTNPDLGEPDDTIRERGAHVDEIDLTQTEVFDLFEDADPKETKTALSDKTALDFDQTTTDSFDAPEPADADETVSFELDPTVDLDGGVDPNADTGSVDPDADTGDVDETKTFHDQDTADFEPQTQDLGETQDLGPVTTASAPEAITASDPNAAPVPMPRRPGDRATFRKTKRPSAFGALWTKLATKLRERRGDKPSLGARAKEFFRPSNFFRGAKQELKTAVQAWVSTGRRQQADIKLEKTAEWWRRTLVEIGALYAIVVPIELIASQGQLGSFGVHPHPYWLIVLPMAAARGVVAGLVAAAIASILYTLGAMQALASTPFEDLFDFKTMLEPILFFGVGFFAGEMHDELALRYRKLNKRLDDVQDRTKQLRQERDVLADANKLLERRLVDDAAQFGNMVHSAKRLENAGRREIFDIALDLVEEHCGASSSVLLLLADGSIDLLCHNGWPDDEQGDRLAAARDSDFVQRVIEHGVPVNGLSADEETTTRGPLVVAPLFDHAGVIKALLCIDDLPSSRLNESTITLFFGIAEWLSAILARMSRVRAEEERTGGLLSGPEGEIYLGSPDELGQRLRLEIERSSRYGIATSFLAVQATQWDDITNEGIETADRFVCMHFTGGLRPSDTLYRFGYPGCYLLVLAGTTVEGAQVVRERLMRRVEYNPSQRVGPVEIFATGPDVDAPDLISLVERVAGRFRAASPLALDGKCPVEVPSEVAPGSVDTFIRRLRMETSLATRNSFALHVLGIRAEGEDAADYGLLARHVAEAGSKTLRPTDGVYSIGPSHCAVILPCTGGEESATIAHRLVQAVRRRDPDAPYGDVETMVLGLGDHHADVHSFLEALVRGEKETT